jgi:hypothetical protein
LNNGFAVSIEARSINVGVAIDEQTMSPFHKATKKGYLAFSFNHFIKYSQWRKGMSN